MHKVLPISPGWIGTCTLGLEVMSSRGCSTPGGDQPSRDVCPWHSHHPEGQHQPGMAELASGVTECHLHTGRDKKTSGMGLQCHGPVGWQGHQEQGWQLSHSMDC